jgi:hypothetical protein
MLLVPLTLPLEIDPFTARNEIVTPLTETAVVLTLF